MSNNMLTTKEATLISDLLTMEESACKKARLYSRILTNTKLADEFGRIADNHEKRFNALKYVHIYHRYKNVVSENNDGKFLGL